jgi:hypothetical protein
MRIFSHKYLLLLLMLNTTLFASLANKSAMVFYGKDISYPMVGIHDYIIVQPDLTDTSRDGFSLYSKQMYAYVSVGEISSEVKEFSLIPKKWILSENRAWDSKVLDIKNRDYQEFLFTKVMDPLIAKGFHNFFFDTLDSYQIVAKTDAQRKSYKKALVAFIHQFKKRYPKSKLIINRGFEIIDEIHKEIEAVLFESYYYGLNPKDLFYDRIDDSARTWLDIHIKKIQKYGLDVICLDYLESEDVELSQQTAKDIIKKGMIPYISTKELTSYGYSSKDALAREILVLVDESHTLRDKTSAHLYGSVVFEYLGYIAKLHDVSKSLPKLSDIQKYAAVVVWLPAVVEDTEKLFNWLDEINALDIKIAFVDGFGMGVENDFFKELGIDSFNVGKESRAKIMHSDKMIGFEGKATNPISNKYIQSNSSQKLLIYKNEKAQEHTPAALMPWGGYAVGSAFMSHVSGEKTWIINPFEFFQKALSLKPLPVPDVTTENGNRIFYTMLSTTGFDKSVEGKGDLLAGDTIINEVLKKYQLPQTIISQDDSSIISKITSLKSIQSYKTSDLQIKKGSTNISRTHPWQSHLGPLSIENNNKREIYASFENERFYTNSWNGPFWGFKKVIQSFELTNIPRRFKPIGVHYQMLSGSKHASLTALKSIFDWSVKQDITPLYASEYIPKVREFYNVSITNEKDTWLTAGMKELKSLRLPKEYKGVDFKTSKSVLGLSSHKDNRYISLDREQNHIISLKTKKGSKQPYLIRANAKVIAHKRSAKSQTIEFDGHVALKLSWFLPNGCHITTSPKERKRTIDKSVIHLEFQNSTKASVNVICK